MEWKSGVNPSVKLSFIHKKELLVQISFAGCNIEFISLLLVGTHSMLFNSILHYVLVTAIKKVWVKVHDNSPAIWHSFSVNKPVTWLTSVK